ncbi:WhiB family transcriptional regulator [Streptomyces sp. LUP30]|uniref:WhiB family transcriptional regulator n=1 Tax=Streptomyces sp. LUP30 TaxID=1890285 RepID=UPI0008519BAE|nr:WhiB family transcriptional regulator [Streptomyces sp. LUP30]
MTSLHTLTATTPGLPCRTTDPELWFSKSSTDRDRAIALCEECPIRRECAQYALDDREVSGVWGGTTLADRRQFWTGQQHRLDELGRIRLVCGSERAYRAHFSYREQPCGECVAAHEALVESERRAQLEAEHAAGGSSRGYFIHRRLGEPVCDDCREALRADRREQRERDRAAGDRARAAWDARKSADARRGLQIATQRLALAG